MMIDHLSHIDSVYQFSSFENLESKVSGYLNLVNIIQNLSRLPSYCGVDVVIKTCRVLRRLVTKRGILKMLSFLSSNCSTHLALAQNKRKIANNQAKFHQKGNIPFYTFKLFPISEVHYNVWEIWCDDFIGLIKRICPTIYLEKSTSCWKYYSNMETINVFLRNQAEMAYFYYFVLNRR